MTPIAIVGRACVLPGALSPQQLWDAVAAGRDLTRGVPAGRWRVPGPVLCAADAPSPDRCWSDRGGYVEGFEAVWNPHGFALPPTQLEGLDPLVHWLLHCGREALSEVRARPARAGAVVGNLGFPSEAMADYADHVWRGLPPGDPRNRAMSGGTAALLAQALGLTAGSWCLDAACASSLYAIKLACDALADGEADLMLAGAVQRADDLFLHLGFAALGALSRSGQSRPFHREADGLLPAEGCALLALKRLDDARRDGDTIHAVIRGIGLSNDGRGKGLLVPDASGQRRAMQAALADAGIDPAQVSLLECHATGTPVGDGTELISTAQVYGARPLAIGSLKSNLGHLITAAGAAGLIKLTEALRHGVLPPNRAVDAPLAALATSPLRLLQSPEPWPADAPRIAAISAFGFGGNNAHLILSDAALVETSLPGFPEAQGSSGASSALRGTAGGAECVSPVEPSLLGFPAAQGPSGASSALRGTAGGAESASPVEPSLLGFPEVHVPSGASSALRGRAGGAESASPVEPSLLGFPEAHAPSGASSALRGRAGGAECVSSVEPSLLGFPEGHGPSGASSALRGTAGGAECVSPVAPSLLGFPEAHAPSGASSALRGRAGGAECVSPVEPSLLGFPEAHAPSGASSALRGRAGGAECVSSVEPSLLGSSPAHRSSGASTALRGDTPIAIVGIGACLGRAMDRPAVAAALFGEAALEPRMESIELDLAGLRFPPKDLEQALPQQLAILRAAREALAASGPLPPRSSVLVGMEPDAEIARYGTRWRSANAAAKDGVIAPLEAAGVLGCMPNIPANRLSSQFDCGGPSYTLQAGADSGLVVLRIAARALAHGEIDAALVGAVDLCDEPVNRAAGNAHPGDAAVALVLRRLADAERDGQRVLALVGGQPVGAGSARDLLAFPTRDRGHSPLPQEQVLAADLGAAAGLVDALHATLCLHHRRHADGRPWLGAATRTVELPLSGMPGIQLSEARGHCRVSDTPTPRLHLYAGADRAQVVANLRADRTGGEGPARLVLVARDDEWADVRQRALAHLEDGAPAGQSVHFRERPLGGQLAFCFAGAGASYRGMGRELLLAMPQLLERLAARSTRLCEVLDWSFDASAPPPSALQQLWGASGLSQAHAEFSQGVLGLRPDAWIGYSSGETNALVASGAWRDADALMAEMESSGLVTRLLGGAFEAVTPQWGRAVDWASWTVLAPLAEVREALAGVPRVHLAIINSDSDCLIAGDAAGCATVVARLGAHRCLKLDYPLAVHVPELDAVAGAWLALHRRETFPTQRGRLYSTAAARAYAPEREACAQAILAQANRTLDLRPLVRQAWEDGVRVFVEHGPGNSFARAIRNILGEREALVVSLDRKGAGLDGALAAAAALLAAGVPVDVAALHAELPCAAPLPAPQRPMRFPAHWPPVRLRPPAQPMVPAPKLPPVLDAYRGPPPVVAPRPPAAVAELTRAHAVQSSRPPAAALRAHGSSAAISALQHTLADLASAQQAHVAALAGAQQRYLAVLGQAQLLLLRRSGHAQTREATERSPQRGARPLTGSLPQAPGELAARARPAAHSNTVEPARQPENKPAPSPRFPRAALETHAAGRISEIFGAAFAGQDGYARQVRMPQPPLLLCDRVIAIDGEPMRMGKGRIVTETDVANHAWAVHAGRLPAGVMIEAGQADLMLISWLGVDALNRGERVYRLLGCELTYHGDLPRADDTLHFDIVLDGHAAQGDVRLMFFHYDCVNAGRPQLSVRGGQAGFFTDAELAASAGCLWSPESQAIVAAPRLDPPAVECTRRALPREALESFAAGDAAACFGAGFELARTHTRTPSIHPGRMLLLDRITELAIDGGPWRRGYLRAELDIHPEQWFFAGHFKNDPCMPGTLMFEACLQAMAVYLAGCGYTLKRDGWRFQPVAELPYQLQCRGQVTPKSQRLVTEVFVEERIAGPKPTLYADLLCTVDGLKAFHARRVALELVPDWPAEDPSFQVHASVGWNPGPRPGFHRPAMATDGGIPAMGRGSTLPAPVVDGFAFDARALLASALGQPSAAFGPMYARFDGTTRVPRLPSPPYFFISRIARVDGPIGRMQAGARVVAEYDVPDDAWYFRDNGAPVMPYAVLLEVVLQPCGWLASYVGSALTSDSELGFRNLDGEGVVLAEVSPGCGTLVTEVTLTRVSASGGMIIQGFDVRCHLGGREVYRLSTVFGFFPPEALAAQAGLPEDAVMRGVLEGGARGTGHGVREEPGSCSDESARGGTQPAREQASSSHAPCPVPRAPLLPHAMLRLIDPHPRIDADAGAAGLGQVLAQRQVDPGEWYFKAHFFQDPVQPGSLGLEALLQALACYLRDWNAHGDIARPRFQSIATGVSHRWKYRGQVLPHHRLVHATLDITERGRDEHGVYAIARGSLWVDGQRIYEAQGLGVRIVPGAA